MKTISPKVNEKSDILGNKKVLPIYIDLSQCKEIFDNDDITLERNFIKYLIEEIKKQLGIIFEQSKFKLFKEDLSQISDFQYIERALIEGVTIKRSISDTDYNAVSLCNVSVESSCSMTEIGLSSNLSEQKSATINQTISESKSFNVQDLVRTLGSIRRAARINSIYVFVDEFSDLSNEEQVKFAILLKKLLGSKNNIFFKVGTITDRYDFGRDILIGRDIFPVSLDLSDFAEKYGGIVSALKELEKFTIELIEKRLERFCDDISIKRLFGGDFTEIITRITKEAMGVPRTIGMILQGALSQTERNENSKSIAISSINVGIRETRKIYMKQFEGAVKKKVIPGFYMDMWNSLLERAVKEKNKNKNDQRPASHFMLDPIRKKYMNIFSENFLVHCLEDSRASKYGGNYTLFSFDYDICIENNILYAEQKDEFTAVRFIYDDSISMYDCYFMDDLLRSYKCPCCNKIYKEDEVAKAKVKRCYDCDEKLTEIIHQEVPKTAGNYTEVEVKILGLIGMLPECDAMSANEISEKVGCSWQKVALWCSRVLVKNNLINAKKVDNRNYYYDNSETK